MNDANGEMAGKCRLGYCSQTPKKWYPQTWLIYHFAANIIIAAISAKIYFPIVAKILPSTSFLLFEITFEIIEIAEKKEKFQYKKTVILLSFWWKFILFNNQVDLTYETNCILFHLFKYLHCLHCLPFSLI